MFGYRLNDVSRWPFIKWLSIAQGRLRYVILCRIGPKMRDISTFGRPVCLTLDLLARRVNCKETPAQAVKASVRPQAEFAESHVGKILLAYAKRRPDEVSALLNWAAG